MQFLKRELLSVQGFFSFPKDFFENLMEVFPPAYGPMADRFPDPLSGSFPWRRRGLQPPAVE
jgi:hypothetical protein